MIANLPPTQQPPAESDELAACRRAAATARFWAPVEPGVVVKPMVEAAEVTIDRL